MPVVSVTRLRVRSLRYIAPFIFFSLRSARQAKAADGNLGVSLLNDANKAFWTCTVWTTEDAMRSFMLSGSHRKAMPRLLGTGAMRRPWFTGRSKANRSPTGRKRIAGCNGKGDVPR